MVAKSQLSNATSHLRFMCTYTEEPGGEFPVRMIQVNSTSHAAEGMAGSELVRTFCDWSVGFCGFCVGFCHFYFFVVKSVLAHFGVKTEQ